MNANSARFHKTDGVIREAFWTLLREKGFYQLRATDIIKTAGINRSTFYEHYLDKYDLAERLEDELLDDFAAVTDGVIPALLQGCAPGGDGGLGFCQNMVGWLGENGEKLALLMHANGSPGFTKKLKQRMELFWNSHHVTTNDPLRDRFARAGILGFVTGILNEWIESGPEQQSLELFQAVFLEALPPLYAYIRRYGAISGEGGGRGQQRPDPHEPPKEPVFLERKKYSERRGVYDYGK